MQVGENKANQSELGNKVELLELSYNDTPRDVELSPGTSHRKQMTPSRVGGPFAATKNN